MNSKRLMEVFQRALRLAHPQMALAGLREMRDNLVKADLTDHRGWALDGEPNRKGNVHLVPVVRQRIMLEWADGSRVTLEVVDG
jgi:hypothetical protein